MMGCVCLSVRGCVRGRGEGDHCVCVRVCVFSCMRVWGSGCVVW